MKEVEEHSYGMKTLQEALHIRNHVLHMFERANKETDPEVRRRMLTFVASAAARRASRSPVP